MVGVGVCCWMVEGGAVAVWTIVVGGLVEGALGDGEKVKGVEDCVMPGTVTMQSE